MLSGLLWDERDDILRQILSQKSTWNLLQEVKRTTLSIPVFFFPPIAPIPPCPPVVTANEGL